MLAGSTAEARWEELRSLDLFAELTDEGVELLRHEVTLATEREEDPKARATRRPAYVEFAEARAGETLQHQGDLAVRVGVVLSGEAHSILAMKRPGESGETLVATLRRGDWFGDVTALSLLPSPTSVRAAADVQIAWLDERLFRMLVESEEGEPFHEQIDARYRKESLALHLRTTLLFRELDDAALRQLASECKLETVDANEPVFEQGDDVEQFLLVRSGGLKCERTDDEGRRRILGYYMANSSLGEHVVLAESARWPGTVRTIARTELVKIGRERFLQLRASDPPSHRALVRIANRILQDDAGEAGERAIGVEEADVMVERQSFKGGQALVIDQHKCIRCNLCVESCAAVHRDGIPRISKIGTKVASGNVLITACYHCEIPGCMEKCKFGAIRRDPRGNVRFVLENCVGCTECVTGCPYDVIRMVDLLHEQKESTSDTGSWLSRWWTRWTGGGRVSGVGTNGCGRELSLPGTVINFAGEEVSVDGKAIKCDLCAGLPFEACVYNCPTRAITRRTPEALFQDR